MIYKTWIKWRKVIILGFLITTLALGLRVWNLTSLPVFADEAIYIRWSQIMASEPSLRFLPLSDGKQPLFMWILMFIVRRLGDPVVAGRAISALSGIGTLVGIFGLSYVLFRSFQVSLIAALMWAISPFSVFYDRLALVDSLLASLSVWAMLGSVVMVKSKRIDVAMVTGGLLGFAALTKSPALFIAITMPHAFVFEKWPKRSKALSFLRLAGLFSIVYVVAFGMYNILRLGPNFQLLSSRTGDYIFSIDRPLTHPFDPFFANSLAYIDWVWKMGPGEIILLFAVGIIVNLRARLREIAFLNFWFFVPFFAHVFYAKAFTARYTLFFLPALFIVGASSFLIKSRRWKGVLYIVLGVFILHAIWFNFLLFTKPEAAPLPRRVRSGFLEEWTSGTGIREVADFIRQEHGQNPEQRIVVGTEGYFGTLPNGLEIELDGVENVVVIGVGLGISEVPESLVESKMAGNRTFLVINNSRLKSDPEQLGFDIIREFPKAERKEGTSEYLRHGPRESLFLLELVDSFEKVDGK